MLSIRHNKWRGMASVRNFFIRNEIPRQISEFEEEQLIVRRIFQYVKWTMNCAERFVWWKYFLFEKRNWSLERQFNYVCEISRKFLILNKKLFLIQNEQYVILFSLKTKIRWLLERIVRETFKLKVIRGTRTRKNNIK